MKSKFYINLIILSFLLISTSSISAEEFGYNYLKQEDTLKNLNDINITDPSGQQVILYNDTSNKWYNSYLNDSAHHVNASDYWITGDRGSLRNVADIILSWITPSDFDMTGYSLTTSFLLGVVGAIDMRGDPWYLSGTDLQIAEDLIVDGNISGMGVGSYFNSTLIVDGNIADGDATFVVNSEINLHSCINLTEGSGQLGFQICNDGSGINRLVFSSAHDGYEWFWIDRDDGTINFLNDTIFTNIIVENINSTGNITANNYFGNISDTTLGYGSETIKELFDDTLNRGILDGFNITDTGGLNFNWTDGEVYNEATKSIIDISLGSGSCTNNAVNYLKWVSGTTLTISTVRPTSAEIGIGVLSCQANDIWFIQTEDILNEREAEMSDASAEITPEVVTAGLIVTEDTDVTSPWDVNLSAGTYYIDGHQKEDVSLISSRINNLIQWFHVGGVYTTTTTSTINWTYWDDGTNPVEVSVPKYYRSNFCVLDGDLHWIMAVEEFNTIAGALAGECPPRPPGLQNCVRSTCLVLKGSATALPVSGSDQWLDVRPLAGRSTSGTVTDHGNLAGLGDDDHTQYLLEDGSRSLSANWNQGAFNFTNILSWWFGNVNSSSIISTNNITAGGFFVGDGSQLTGIVSGLWTNVSGVATYDGNVNITQNITIGGCTIWQNTTDVIEYC